MNLLSICLKKVLGESYAGINTAWPLVFHDDAVARGEMINVELKKGRIVVFITWFGFWKCSDLLHDFSLSAVGARTVLDDLGDVRPVHSLYRFQASAGYNSWKAEMPIKPAAALPQTNLYKWKTYVMKSKWRWRPGRGQTGLSWLSWCLMMFAKCGCCRVSAPCFQTLVYIAWLSRRPFSLEAVATPLFPF